MATIGRWICGPDLIWWNIFLSSNQGPPLSSRRRRLNRRRERWSYRAERWCLRPVGSSSLECLLSRATVVGFQWGLLLQDCSGMGDITWEALGRRWSTERGVWWQAASLGLWRRWELSPRVPFGCKPVQQRWWILLDIFLGSTTLETAPNITVVAMMKLGFKHSNFAKIHS
jgi:hypothetical protein